MKLALGLLVGTATACAPRSAPGPTVENSRPAAPDVQSPAASSIPRDEIALARPPASLAVGRQLLVGRWEGKRYDYDSEHAFAGEEGSAPRKVMELTAGGRYTIVEEGCATVGRYALEHHPESGYELRLSRERDCRGDPPYEYPSYVHRLDGEVLVLIDGVTAAVSAFRRQP